MKAAGGEFGIVVIGALSAWLMHTGKLMQVLKLLNKTAQTISIP